MKTAELTGAMLDYWVARAEGVPDLALFFVGSNTPAWREACSIAGSGMFRPSTKWEQGGPLIERRRISLTERGNDGWAADAPGAWCMEGSAPLIAAMRALVASVYGDTVPDEPA